MQNVDNISIKGLVNFWEYNVPYRSQSCHTIYHEEVFIIVCSTRTTTLHTKSIHLHQHLFKQFLQVEVANFLSSPFHSI